VAGEIVGDGRELHRYLRDHVRARQPMPDTPTHNLVQPVELISDASHLVRLPRAPILGAGGFQAPAVLLSIVVVELVATTRPIVVYGAACGLLTLHLYLGASRIESTRVVQAIPTGAGPEPLTANIVSGERAAVPLENGLVLDPAANNNFFQPLGVYLEPPQVCALVGQAVNTLVNASFLWLEIP
jgi:hypothetical protein